MEMNELATEVFTQAIKHQLDDIHLLPVGEEYVFYLRDVNGLKRVEKNFGRSGLYNLFRT